MTNLIWRHRLHRVLPVPLNIYQILSEEEDKMKSINSCMPKQTRSLDRNEKTEVIMQGAAGTTSGIKASGWLDVLGKAAKGALGAVMG
ncbi:MAG: hypothetical protein ACI9LM_003747 [Alteromonadaceae bacterium]|jgi:hypothetical protein